MTNYVITLHTHKSKQSIAMLIASRKEQAHGSDTIFPRRRRFHRPING
jgi:hypothetical protein